MDENQSPATEQPAQADSAAEQSIEDRVLAKFGMEGLTDDAPGEAQQGDEAATEQPDAQADDSAEVSIDGKTFRVPKELKDAVLRHEDYTRKTQDVAERARVLDAQARMLQEREAFQTAHASDLQALQTLQQQIRDYSQMDMSQLTTDQLIKVKMHVDNLKEAERAKLTEVHGKAQEFQGRINQSLQELQAKGQDVLKKAIPKWGSEEVKSLTEYGVSQGYQQHELAQLFDPRHVITLWKASQWDKLQSGKPLAQQRAQDAQPVLKPGSSNPEMNARMAKVRFAKDIKAAPTSQDKAKLIQGRLERMF